MNVVKVRDTINTSKHSAVTSAMLSSAPDHTMFPTGVWKATLSVSNASRINVIQIIIAVWLKRLQ